MRTIVVHLRSATEDQVEGFLKRTYPMQDGPPWISAIDGDACLYIEIYRDLASEADPQEVASLRKALGDEPTVSVMANVSGRHPGGPEVRDFVSRLLSEFEGLLEDDFTEGYWTLAEIQREETKSSRQRNKEQKRTFSTMGILWNKGPMHAVMLALLCARSRGRAC